MKKRDLEKNLETKLEEELKDVIALLRGIDRSKKKLFPEENYEKVCTEGLKQGGELFENLTDEKLKDDLFSELIEAEYDLAGRLVKEERYGKAIEHFQNLNQMGKKVHEKFSKIVRNKDFNSEFIRKTKVLLKKYPGDDLENIEKYSIEQAEIDKPHTFNREAEKLIFCTHLSLAYIHAFKRDINKVVDETIEALKWGNADVKWPYGGVDIREFVPFNLRKSYYQKSWFRKTEKFRLGDFAEEDAYVAIFGMSKEKSDQLTDRISKINQPKLDSFRTFQEPIAPFDDPLTPLDPFKIDIPKIEKFKSKDSFQKSRHKEDVSNRREYCKKLMSLVILANEWKVNEKTLSAAYKIIATDPTDPGNYLFLMALLGQERKKKEKQDVMNDVVRLISTKASIKDYDSESVNPNYESVLKANRYVSKPESEETAKKQHILSNFFLKHAKDENMFAKSYGYAEGVDGKFYLVTELLNEDNLSTFGQILSKLDDEEKKKRLEQAIDIIVEMQEIYETKKEKLEYKLNDYDCTTVLKTKVIERLKGSKFEGLIGFLDKNLEKQKRTFSHCDFHLDNILKVKSDNSAVIDFAKVALAPELFDLAYLLEQEQLDLSWEQKQDHFKYFLSKKEKKISKKVIKDYHYNAFLINLLGAGAFTRFAEIAKDEDLQEKYETRSMKYLFNTHNAFKSLLEYVTDSEEEQIVEFANKPFLDYINYRGKV